MRLKYITLYIIIITSYKQLVLGDLVQELGVIL